MFFRKTHAPPPARSSVRAVEGRQRTRYELGFFNSIRAITLWSLKALAQMVLQLLSGNGFHSSGHCDLDLWPTEPKINRGLLLNKGYHPMKFEGSGSKGTRVIERKRSVTDGQTDGRTDRQGKNNMSPPEGGDITTQWCSTGSHCAACIWIPLTIKPLFNARNFLRSKWLICSFSHSLLW